MLSFRDFIPADVTKIIAISRKYETLADVVDRVNTWVTQENIDVINIETVILPPIGKTGASDAAYTDNMQVDIGMFSFGGQRQQIARVWYRKR